MCGGCDNEWTTWGCGNRWHCGTLKIDGTGAVRMGGTVGLLEWLALWGSENGWHFGAVGVDGTVGGICGGRGEE